MTAADQIELIEVWTRCEPPGLSIVARFWYSHARGLTCDAPEFARMHSEWGLVVPHDKVGDFKIVRLDEPELFFRTLPYHLSGSYVWANLPIAVEIQGGEPIN